MDSAKNQFGLDRNIPASIKRTVRQRDGFGCIHCGNALYTYDHFDPEYKDALAHRPEGIWLLCDRCHRKKTAGLLSLETLRAALANPKCKQAGFSWESFDIVGHPEVHLGISVFIEPKVILRAFDVDLLAVKSPEVEGGPFRIDASFFDASGTLVLEIANNEWRAHATNWDVAVGGRRIEIRRSPGDIALIIRSEPPARLIIERLKMAYKQMTIEAQEGRDLAVATSNGNLVQGLALRAVGCEIGYHITDHSIAVGCRCRKILALESAQGARIQSGRGV